MDQSVAVLDAGWPPQFAVYWRAKKDFHLLVEKLEILYMNTLNLIFPKIGVLNVPVPSELIPPCLHPHPRTLKPCELPGQHLLPYSRESGGQRLHPDR